MRSKLNTFLRDTGWYFLPFAVLWIVSMVYLFQYGERKTFLLCNSFHSKILDHPLLWLTEISGGYIIISLFVLIYARSKPAESLFAVILVFVTWYATIAIKYNHFSDWKSPASLFKGQNVHVLGNQQIQPELNFPSSQAAIITALFLFVAWHYRGSVSKVIFAAIIAVLLIYTRIYVGWAYPGDVLSGSILGSLIAVPLIPWYLPKTERWYDKRNDWWQKMIIAILRAAAICTILVNLKDFVL
ncbi:MAG: phosphatase PAP2 family protein [Chitinophagaceae bacterium]|nr:MAG: phosphatase PAP2 family protein [Chitinophagaceae bacterium]